jgi:5,5'-dehydrodivanillate O-demethylase
MPNVFHMHTSIPSDPDIGWKECLFWWVPVDDHKHRQFRVNLVPVTGEAATKYLERQESIKTKADLPHAELAEAILEGKLWLDDVDPARTDLVRLQDDIAQIGQGRIANREAERFGRADIGVILIRKLWCRELQALADGRPLKQWRRPLGLRPKNWHPAADA